eukprot:TRINITY_DN6135_c0_g1_i1.p1 TRINITY_DN6135_c0_g1~~TRINITY_DN6135_c0_g1_i1.p1  ORF type:complete len:358 (-),score=81.51 TRINITY_DN6135_c0_g1_i1:376-1449(-)
MSKIVTKNVQCGVCYGNRYIKSNGSYICAGCNTLSQEIVDFESEFDTNLKGRLYVGSVRLMKQRKRNLGFESRDLDFLEAFQFILKIQINCLVSQKGIHPDLEDIVGHFWFVFLERYYEMQEIGMNEEQEESIDGDEAMRDEVVEGDENPSLGEGDTPEKKKKKKENYPFTLTITSSLSFLFLGLIWLKEPYTESDIVKWAIKGEIPYLNMAADPHVVAHTDKIKQHHFRNYLTPSRRITPNKIHKVTRQICQFISVDPPGLNAPLVINRYFEELHFPVSLAPLAIGLFFQYKTELTIHTFVSMRVVLMSYVVYIMKLVYKFDDKFDRPLRKFGQFTIPHSNLREFISEQKQFLEKY